MIQLGLEQNQVFWSTSACEWDPVNANLPSFPYNP